MHVLSIGNSFADDAQAYVYDILKTDGLDDIIIANLYIGGCSLERHAENIRDGKKDYEFKVYSAEGYQVYPSYSVSMGLLYTKWDFITFQQASHFSGIQETYSDKNGNSYFSVLRDYILSVLPYEPKFLFHETWSYEKGFDGDSFKNYDYSQELMEEKIGECRKKCVDTWPYFDGVINSLSVIRILRMTHGRPVTRDGYHLYMGISRYAASLMFAYKVHPLSGLATEKEYDLVSMSEKIQARNAVLYAIKEDF